MHFNCYNCDQIVELADSHKDLEQNRCEHCMALLDADLYCMCLSCQTYYLKIYSACTECRAAKGMVPMMSTPQLGSGWQEGAAVRQPPPVLPPLQYTYVQNQEQYQIALNYLNDLSIIALDTEGNGLSAFDNDMLLIQLGDVGHVYVFDFNYFPQLAQEQFWTNPSVHFVIHNAVFDLKMLLHQIGVMPVNIIDTMLAERVLTCGMGRYNSLAAVTEKYLGLEMDKTLSTGLVGVNKDTFAEHLHPAMLRYAALDVQTLIPIWQAQQAALAQQELMAVVQLEFAVAGVVAQMELRGIYVDTEKWKEIIVRAAERKVETEKEIRELISQTAADRDLFGESNINLNSQQQLLKLFSQLGIPATSTRDGDLALIDHPVVAKLREYREVEKLVSAFGESFLAHVRNTGRVHPSFQQIGADTGRFSCYGPNLQQIPATEEFRSCFTAPPGRKIVTCDYSQQELRILASLSGDIKFIKMYEDEVDLHTATASMMFDVPLDKVDKPMRQIAKTINFGLAYGRGAKALAKVLGVSEQEGEDMIKKYFAQFGSVRDWLEGAAQFAQKQGMSKTMLGRKRFYPLPDKNDPEYRTKLSAIGRQGKNSPIQGSAVDMVKLALVDIHQRLLDAKLDAFIINCVHDEIVVEASEQDAEKAKQILHDCMVRAGEKLIANVPIVAEAQVGDWWAH